MNIMDPFVEQLEDFQELVCNVEIAAELVRIVMELQGGDDQAELHM